LKTFELKNRDICLLSSVSIQKEFSASKQVISMKANETGTSICLHGTGSSTEIKVFSITSGKMFSHDCGTIIKSFYWDVKTPKVLICELENAEESKVSSQIISFFSTPNQLIFKDSQIAPENSQQLLGISLPFIIYKRVGYFFI
jgi:hypothetical protein